MNVDLHVVWFKNDLRVVDHEPLVRAAESGVVLPLYVYEPDVLAQPTADARHLDFANQCLTELDEDLSALGERVERFASGTTGFPMVDACMRATNATGWLNFRMRAMVVSFASYHLWLDWRPVAALLARMWTDDEPGIHSPQHQMQSGSTGINTITAMLARFLQSLDEALVPMDDDLELAGHDGGSLRGDQKAASYLGAADLDLDRARR